MSDSDCALDSDSALDPGSNTSLGARLRRATASQGFAGDVYDDLSRRVAFSTDNSIYQVVPRCIAAARETADLARLVRAVATLEAPVPLVARGGGTGTNGQSLTEDVVVDCAALNRILSVDPERRRAWVEPGVVLDQLNRYVAEHSLFFPPHVSTSSRATLGGMVSTDAAGKGSRIYGRTSDHIAALRVVTVDGQEHELRALPMAEARERARQGDGLGRLYGKLLELLEPGRERIVESWPRLQRGFSGYNLRGAFGFASGAQVPGTPAEGTPAEVPGTPDVFDPVRLICGSEGTLVLVSGIEVKLTPKPRERALVVVTYDDFIAALRDLPHLLAADPAAIEAMDETVQGLSSRSSAWASLVDVLPVAGGSSLFVELVDDDAGRLEGRLQLLERQTRARIGEPTRRGPVEVTVIRDAAQQSAVWAARKDAVGLLAKAGRDIAEDDGAQGRPQAFVEDCAVPAEQLADFIQGFREILDHEGLIYGIYGHADAGCVHVRPSLDLGDAKLARAQLRRISDRVAALAAEHGGVLWGEHGIGFRGEYAADRLGPELHRLMLGVKRIFDPEGRFNPHKLYDRSLKALDAVPMRADRDGGVDPDARRRFADAFRCNGNGACHTRAPSAVMCPSFQATGDHRQSPKGRSDLLREWLRRRSGAAVPTAEERAETEELERDLRQSLNGCLSCKACASQCPAEVDIPELKSRFLEEIHRTERRPWREYLMLALERFGPVVAPWGRWINPLMHNPFSRRLTAGLGLVDLPRFSVPSLQRRMKVRGARVWTVDRLVASAAPVDGSTVVLLADPFNALFDAQALTAAHDLIAGLGFRPLLVALGPTGKFEHVKGFRDRFRRAAVDRMRDLARLSAWSKTHGVGEPLILEPSVALLFSQEYVSQGVTSQADRRSEAEPPTVRWIQDWLLEVLPSRTDRFERPSERTDRISGGSTAQVFVHCSEKAARPGTGGSWIAVLKLLSQDAVEVAVGCCGMAGVFGHEAENADVARRLFDTGWREPLTRSKTISVATGFSCRCHAHHLTGDRPRHPVELLVLLLKPLYAASNP